MRITGGQYKNKKLHVPDGKAVRPTSDRMRQSLFNILHHAKWLNGFEIEDSNVLDVFCGTGALGVEAISHGAKHCVFIDQDISTVKQNVKILSDNQYKIIKSNALGLRQGNGDVNLVFMDPPYRKDLIEPVVELLINKNWLSDNAVIIIESEKNLQLNFIDLELMDKRSQAQSDLHFFLYNSAVK